MVPLHTLTQLRFLEGLPEQVLKPLAAVAEVVDKPAGSVLFQQGEPSANVFLVVHGLIGLEVWTPGTGATLVQRIGPGELLGWTPLLSAGAMTASAQVLEPAKLVSINALQLLAVMARDGAFGTELMRRVAIAVSKRLYAARMQLADASAALVSE